MDKASTFHSCPCYLNKVVCNVRSGNQSLLVSRLLPIHMQFTEIKRSICSKRDGMKLRFFVCRLSLSKILGLTNVHPPLTPVDKRCLFTVINVSTGNKPNTGRMGSISGWVTANSKIQYFAACPVSWSALKKHFTSRNDRIVDFYYPILSCFWKMISISDPNPV